MLKHHLTQLLNFPFNEIDILSTITSLKVKDRVHVYKLLKISLETRV